MLNILLIVVGVIVVLFVIVMIIGYIDDKRSPFITDAEITEATEWANKPKNGLFGKIEQSFADDYLEDVMERVMIKTVIDDYVETRDKK